MFMVTRFRQVFDSGRSLRGSRCPKKLKCKFTEKFCRKIFGNGYFPARKRSPEECCLTSLCFTTKDCHPPLKGKRMQNYVPCDCERDS